jgi:hypothetical protein
VFPYYEKVKQYAWIEHRDVWSYPLALSDAETERLVDHLWEMDGVHFDYYFLTKNCSYQLLSLLEVARPALRLTEKYSWYAIPADTIRTLADVPGLMGTRAIGRRWRPRCAGRRTSSRPVSASWHANSPPMSLPSTIPG